MLIFKRKFSLAKRGRQKCTYSLCGDMTETDVPLPLETMLTSEAEKTCVIAYWCHGLRAPPV